MLCCGMCYVVEVCLCCSQHEISHAGLQECPGDPPFLMQNVCDSLPFDHQSILIMALKKYFVRITQYCGFQNHVRVFLEGDASLSLSDD